MEHLFESLSIGCALRLTWNASRRSFAASTDPFAFRAINPPCPEAVVEPPTCHLTVFKPHLANLTLKVCSKGARLLRFEMTVHNTKTLSLKRSLDHFPSLLIYLSSIVVRFLDTLQAVEITLISDDLLERLPTPAPSATPLLRAFISTNPTCGPFYKPSWLCRFRPNCQSPPHLGRRRCSLSRTSHRL